MDSSCSGLVTEKLNWIGDWVKPPTRKTSSIGGKIPKVKIGKVAGSIVPSPSNGALGICTNPL